MITIDPMLFADVADVLSISNPVLVEKDYYAVLLLKELSALRFDDYQLVFAGGTCLTKVHQNTHRMSEDIDIKLVASDVALGRSHSMQRQNRKVIHQSIVSMLESSPLFQLVETKKRNEGKFQQFLIQYPRYHDLVDALRPHIQLEITESALLEPAIEKSIRSLYAETNQSEPEVALFPCVTMETTASEKFVSLLRRTAACNRDTTQADDATLIRHVYDLHLIGLVLTDFNSIKALVTQVIQIDVDQFGNRHEEFRGNPSQELKYGLNLLVTKPIYRAQYKQFIGPLVYHPTPATWDEAIKTVLRMSEEWL